LFHAALVYSDSRKKIIENSTFQFQVYFNQPPTEKQAITMLNSLVGVFSRRSPLFSRDLTLITRAKKKKAAGGKKCKF